MKNFVLIIFSGLIQLACSQNPKSSSEWLNKNTIELQQNGTYDFTKLKDVLKNKQIVALGESTHGLAEFYKIKSALVLYLHQELGYEVLAMESGLGDINLAYNDIDTISAKNLRDHTLFGNFKAKEVDTLFDYIKSTSSTKKPLFYTGYDTQFSSNYLITKLVDLLNPIDKTLSDSLFNRMYSFQKSFSAARNNDSIDYIKHRDIFIKNATDISQTLEVNKHTLLNSNKLNHKEYLMIQKTLEMFVRSTDLSFEDRFQSIELRDELMAENLVWLLKEIYPNKKVIVWAHNAHIENNSAEGYNLKLMGHYLKEKYKDNYYSIGLFAYEGKAYQHWTKNTIPFKNNDSIAIEKRFFDTNKNVSFLNLSKVRETQFTKWLFETNTGFELENGGNIPFIPTKRFDGIITIQRSGIPTYDSEN
ncbi:MAG: erythromycin esterase family protein [Flavobacteriaceae bacterium]